MIIIIMLLFVKFLAFLVTCPILTGLIVAACGGAWVVCCGAAAARSGAAAAARGGAVAARGGAAAACGGAAAALDRAAAARGGAEAARSGAAAARGKTYDKIYFLFMKPIYGFLCSFVIAPQQYFPAMSNIGFRIFIEK